MLQPLNQQHCTRCNRRKSQGFTMPLRLFGMQCWILPHEIADLGMKFQILAFTATPVRDRIRITAGLKNFSRN